MDDRVFNSEYEYSNSVQPIYFYQIKGTLITQQHVLFLYLKHKGTVTVTLNVNNQDPRFWHCQRANCGQTVAIRCSGFNIKLEVLAGWPKAAIRFSNTDLQLQQIGAIIIVKLWKTHMCMYIYNYR